MSGRLLALPSLGYPLVFDLQINQSGLNLNRRNAKKTACDPTHWRFVWFGYRRRLKMMITVLPARRRIGLINRLITPIIYCILPLSYVNHSIRIRSCSGPV